jgi:predicted MFS family arabinose efflux permease
MAGEGGAPTTVVAGGSGRRSRDRGAGPSFRARALVPTLVLVGALVAIVSSLGALLIPSIAQADHVNLSTAQWLLTAALLAGALATPIMGRLADGPRQRDVIFGALVVVMVGCVLAAVSDRFIVVVAGRALQGVGLGLLPVTMAIARRHLSAEKAGRAIATLSITVAVGGGLGYPLTGLITEVANFHAAFWFGAVMVAMALVAAALILPPASSTPARPFDTPGAVALSLGVVGLLVVLSEGGHWGWTSATALGVSGASLVALGVWILLELRTEDPLVELRQVRNRSVLTADISGFLICVAMYLFLPILIEFVQVPAVEGYGFGASLIVSSLVFLPLSVTTFAASRFLGLYERNFGTRSMIPLGSVIFAASTLFFALEHGALWEAFAASGLAGLGVGLTFAAMPGFIVRAVPHRETGSATGFYQVLRNIGLSTGSALGAAILIAFTHPGHTFPTVGGFHTALLVASGLCLLTAGISYVLPGAEADRGVSAVESDATRQREDLIMGEEAELAGAGLMLAEERLPLAEEAPS